MLKSQFGELLSCEHPPVADGIVSHAAQAILGVDASIGILHVVPGEIGF